MSNIPYSTLIVAPFSVESLMAGRHTEAAFRSLMWTKVPGLTHWLGGISQSSKSGVRTPKNGIFWTPNPVRAPEYSTTYDGAKWKIGDAVFAGSDKIVQLTCCFAENDTGSPEEQAQRIIDEVCKGMPVPSAIVWSGGKSFHVYWLLDQDAMPRHADWFKVQCAMINALKADRSVKKYEQRMRYGCNQTRQAGPFGEGEEVRDQRVAYLGEAVSLDALVAWAATVPEAIQVSSYQGGVAGNKGLRQDWSKFPHPKSSGTLREFADALTKKVAIPCHLHDDSTASAFASRGPSGAVYIYCSVCDCTSRDHQTVDLSQFEDVFQDENLSLVSMTEGSVTEPAPDNPIVKEVLRVIRRGGHPDEPLDVNHWMETEANDAYWDWMEVNETSPVFTVDPDSIQLFSDDDPLRGSEDETNIAESTFKRLDLGFLTCSRGVVGLYAAGGYAAMLGTACWSMSCAVCGPRMTQAMIIAISAVSAGYELKYGPTQGFVYSTKDHTRADDYMKKELASRGTEALALAVSPTEIRYLFLHRPVAGQEALFTGTIKDATVCLTESVSLQSWTDAVTAKTCKRIRLLRGSNPLAGIVVKIRDYIVGNSTKTGKKPISNKKGGEETYFGFVKSVRPFEEAMSDILQETVRFIPEVDNIRKGTRKASMKVPVDTVGLAKQLFIDGKLERPAPGKRRDSTPVLDLNLINAE